MALIVVRLDPYEGDDTALRTHDGQPMYVIVDTELHVVDDYGYRTEAEALDVLRERR